MSKLLENLFMQELKKVGYPVISKMGQIVPVPELAPAMPWNLNEKAIGYVRTRTVGNKFSILLYLNEERRGVPLPFGYATFDVVEHGELYMRGAYLFQTLTFSEYELVPNTRKKSYKEDMINSQLEAVAIRFAKSIEEIAFQTLFNQLNS